MRLKRKISGSRPDYRTEAEKSTSYLTSSTSRELPSRITLPTSLEKTKP